MLALARLVADVKEGEALARRALDSGAAAERFARMVRGLGGPADVLGARFAGLARAPVVLDVPAPRAGVLQAMDTRAVGLAVVDLGGGRRRASDPVDPRVGLSQVLPLGARVAAGEPLMRVHAADQAAARAAIERIMLAVSVGGEAPVTRPTVIARVARG